MVVLSVRVTASVMRLMSVVMSVMLVMWVISANMMPPNAMVTANSSPVLRASVIKASQALSVINACRATLAPIVWVRAVPRALI
jgi:hypothetical protein